jgi:hypothetical protein
MSYDAYAIHIYGIETDDLDKYHFKKDIETELEDLGEDLFFLMSDGEALDSQHCEEYKDLECISTAGNLYAIGFSIQAPWAMDIIDQNEMNRQIQSFLEDVYEDIPKDFAKKHADEIYYAWIED